MIRLQEKGKEEPSDSQISGLRKLASFLTHHPVNGDVNTKIKYPKGRRFLKDERLDFGRREFVKAIVLTCVFSRPMLKNRA